MNHVVSRNCTMGSVISIFSHLCYGIARVVYDFAIGLVRCLFFNIVEPTVLVFAGLAYGLCLGLAFIIQSPFKAAQDWWALQQSRRRVSKWRDAGAPSRSRHVSGYQHLGPISTIPSP
ncbi:hypothetical protein BD310DRAFT_937481 [Dichomitus squalens]|uniref:Uncharacterized protein n=1 Tax=Dichomitus squalens TaxID=114155 RepID=A0A4Q9PGP1_9APHY|nr:hypothetical protein BD310DRAFT_937481 [Dichomitus squalens]